MTKDKSAISAEDIVAYIAAHPDCLAHRPDLLTQCLAASKSVSGNNAYDQANIVDLSPALAARARDEARRVGLAHKSLLHVAAENMVSWRRLHHATLGLLACSDLVGLCHVISTEFPIIFDVEKLSTHGGSLRVFAQRRDYGAAAISPMVAKLLSEEEAAGVTNISFYQTFQRQAEKIKDELLAYLSNAKCRGLKLAGYGAAAKGNTLLNFAGIRPDLLPYVVDKSPAKCGKFMPGSKIPIVDEKFLRQKMLTQKMFMGVEK